MTPATGSLVNHTYKPAQSEQSITRTNTGVHNSRACQSCEPSYDLMQDRNKPERTAAEKDLIFRNKRIGGKSRVRRNPAYNVRKLSKFAYIFVPSNTEKLPDRLVITSHGSRLTSDKFTVRHDTQLRFFSEDKHSLEDPSTTTFLIKATEKSQPVEVISKQARCYNYDLEKYTNSDKNSSHNNADENYEELQNMLNELQEFSEHSTPCVLTIRNRWSLPSVPLKKVITNLRKKGFQFTTIDCLFCRSKLKPTDMIPFMKSSTSVSDQVVFLN